MTVVTPSTVSAVSATLVASTTRRRGPRAERALLLVERLVAVQRHDVDVRAAPASASAVRRISAAPGRKTSTSPGSASTRAHRRRRRARRAAPRGGSGAVLERDRMRAALRGEHRGVAAGSARERLGVERRRHDDELQVGPHGLLQLAHDGEREVALQVALVELVEHDDADVLEERVVGELAAEDALGDEPEPRRGPAALLEAHAVADLAADARRRARARRTPPRRARRCGAARARAPARRPRGRRRAAPRARASSCPRRARARSTRRRPRRERVDARRAAAGRSAAARGLPRRDDAPLEDAVHAVVDGDHRPAHRRRRAFFGDARGGGARRLHAPGVRQHLRAAHAGRARAGRSRLRHTRRRRARRRARAGATRRCASAVYTHGHADHAFGLRAWLAAGERPEIVAQENCVARFHRYRLMHGLNAHINQRQFSLPAPMFPQHFDWPTLLVHDAPDAAPRRRRGALPRGARRDRRPPLGVGAGARAASSPATSSSGRRRTAATRRRCSATPRSGRDALETMAGARRRVAASRATASPCRAATPCALVLTETARYLRHHRRPGARRA